MTRAAAVVAVTALAIAACSLLARFDEGKLAENTLERCRDRVDNDGDGLVDCDDPGCAPFSSCAELSAGACRDGKDNDGDGLADCDDPGCAALPGLCTERTAGQCADGVDNDGDGLVDCNDPDCQGLASCQERDDASCSDGVDNDQDGLVDCADFDCYAAPVCCTLGRQPLRGDGFDHVASCSVHACSKGEPTCCTSGYELCSSFDPARWVAWGLPRARQEAGAFVANEPCGCDELSGIVSVESVRLAPGLRLQAELASPGESAGEVCVGLTTSSTFVDDLAQCSGAPLPKLLLGVCLRVDAGPRRRLLALVDGVAGEEREAPSSAPVTASIEVTGAGVKLGAGPLAHLTTALGAELSRGLVLIAGRGTSGRASKLQVSDPDATERACRDPGAWLRHLARGEPVLGKAQGLAGAAHPTLVYLPEAKSYLMLFDAAAPTGASSIRAARSSDGISWTLAPKPAFAPDDARFGARQSSPSLVYRGGLFHLFYSREDDLGAEVQRTIAHATSSDGADWRPSPGAGGSPFVLGPAPAPAWDSLAVYSPSVVELGAGAGLLMLYTGAGAELSPRPALGAARSADGTSWQRRSEGAALAPEAASDLGYEEPQLLRDQARGLYLLWFTRHAFGAPASIAHAVSKDGASWIHYARGAALGPGPLGTFDERGVEAPAALLETGERVRLWYTGLAGSGALQIGYAENRGSR